MPMASITTGRSDDTSIKLAVWITLVAQNRSTRKSFRPKSFGQRSRSLCCDYPAASVVQANRLPTFWTDETDEVWPPLFLSEHEPRLVFRKWDISLAVRATHFSAM
jgi:hypothetical protein